MTSGHIVGAAIVAILLRNSFAGFLVLTVVLIIQGLIFWDRGITTLGINIFNMRILGSFVWYYSFEGFERILGKIPSVFITCFLPLFISAIVCAVELWIAGTFPLVAGLYFMGIYHFVIGIVVEELISTIVYIF